MKNKVNPNHVGMVLGKFAAVVHLLWALLVATGMAQSYMDFVLSLHFLSNPYSVQAFSWGNALMLVVMAFVMGYAVGWVFASLWNWVAGKK